MPICRVDPRVKHAGLCPAMYINKRSANRKERSSEVFVRLVFAVLIAVFAVYSVYASTIGIYNWFETGELPWPWNEIWRMNEPMNQVTTAAFGCSIAAVILMAVSGGTLALTIK